MGQFGSAFPHSAVKSTSIKSFSGSSAGAGPTAGLGAVVGPGWRDDRRIPNRSRGAGFFLLSNFFALGFLSTLLTSALIQGIEGTLASRLRRRLAAIGKIEDGSRK